MEHHKHLLCLGIAHLRDYRVCQLSCLYFPTARACFKAIDKEHLACVGILFYLQLLNSLLGLELGYSSVSMVKFSRTAAGCMDRISSASFTRPSGRLL